MIWPGLAIAADGLLGARITTSHRHHLMLVRDDAVLETDSGVIRLSRGDLAFRPGCRQVSARWKGPAPRRVDVWISRALWPDIEAALPDARPWYRLTDSLIASLVDQLARVAHRRARGDDRIVVGSADLLGARLVEVVPAASPNAVGQAALSAAVLREVCEHIDDQLAQPLAVPELARLANLSESHFTRSFKAATGESPKKYIRRRRIELAQDLLRNSDLPLVDVALETGFGSQSCFTATFSELVGQSPGRFRERARRSS